MSEETGMAQPAGREAHGEQQELDARAARRRDGSLAIVALLLVGVAGWAIWATARAAHSVPGDAAWQRAAAVVRGEFLPGDLITFAPEWIDPVGRLHLGELISIDDAARMDAARFGRIWVLAIRGAEAADAAQWAGTAPALSRDVDGIAVRRYDRAPAIVLDDALRALPSAAATGAIARAPEAVLAEVGFRPRRCVQVVPAAGGAVTLTFPRFTLGSQLVGYVGLADIFTRRDVREPGQLELLIDGKIVAQAQAGIDDGWVRFSAATTPGTKEVQVIARAPSPRARDRLICFAMESRR